MEIEQGKRKWKYLEQVICRWMRNKDLPAEKLIPYIEADWDQKLGRSHPIARDHWNKLCTLLRTEGWNAFYANISAWFKERMEKEAVELALKWTELEKACAYILERQRGLKLYLKEYSQQVWAKFEQHQKLPAAQELTLDILCYKNGMEIKRRIDLDLEKYGSWSLGEIGSHYDVPSDWEWILTGIGRVDKNIVLGDYLWPAGSYLKLIKITRPPNA